MSGFAACRRQRRSGRSPTIRQLGLEAAIVEVPAIADDPETATAVLDATIEAWDRRSPGEIDADVWQSGYQTMQRLGFIDGSVPVDEMYDDGVVVVDVAD